MGKFGDKETRPRMPAWFTKDDSAFFREHISEQIWANILETYNHQALQDECEQNGIPISSVKYYWHKSKRISLFAQPQNEGLSAKAVFDNLCHRFSQIKIPSVDVQPNKKSHYCAIINLYDAHLDKISLAAETGEKATLQDNVIRYEQAFDGLLSKVMEHKPKVVIFPIGNDFFHANDMSGKTKKGTAIQYLSSPEEAYPIVCEVIVNCIYKLLQTGAKIIIPFVKGNHDEDNITILGYWIRKLFKDFDDVQFTPGRMQRNYFRFGVNLFGFAHGDKEKSKINELPLLMAEEAGKDWAVTKYRKFFCGDLHHEFEHRFLKVKDKPGVQISFLRSIGASDKWHTDNGWIGIPKTAYAEIWHDKDGKIAGYEVNF